VHLHLEQRVAQRLLGLIRPQGFDHHDLSRACLAQVRDSIPRVVLLGRLSLYGRRAERLHEELVAVAARWAPPEDRDGTLQPYARDAEARTLVLLDEALGSLLRQPNVRIRERLLVSAPADIDELLPALRERADVAADDAIAKLRDRGEREGRELRETLERQRDRVQAERARHEQEFEQLTLDIPNEERDQLRRNMDWWARRLVQFERDLETEPDRVQQFYEVRARRLEPVGLVYLWPDTN
jgi:hypothetical protein